MKKIILLLNILLITSFVLAQCITTEDANNTISFCKYGGGSIGTEDSRVNNTIVAQAQKWMSSMFTIVIDPAIKKTKGLRGTWNGSVKITTDDGLIPYQMEALMQELGCTKSQKLYEKEESGIIITFHINSLYGIATTSKHTEYVLVKKSTEEKKVFDKVNGRQLYLLNQPTASERYSSFIYYRKEEDGTKNIAVAKEGIPLFLPVSIKEVLLLNKTNYTLVMNGQNKIYTDFIKLGLEGYLAQMDLINFEKTFGKKATEKAKADYKKTYNDQVNGYKKMIEDNIFKKIISNIDSYLKKSSATQLAKPCIVDREIFLEDASITDAIFLNNPTDGMQYITINPAYTNKSNPTAPKFVVVQTSINSKSAVSLSGKNFFEDNIDFKKLQAILLK